MDALFKNIDVPQPLRTEFEVILTEIREKKTDGVNELKSLLNQSPYSIEIIGHLAWALALNKRYDESIELYKRYLKLHPQNVEVRWRIADRLVNMGKIDEAYEAYSAVLKEHPDCQDAAMGIRYINYIKKVKTRDETTGICRRKKLSEFQQNNLDLNREEFRNQKIRLSSLPTNLYLESTTKCNFYCQTCHKGYMPYHAEDLKKDIFGKVCTELMPTNLRISITGYGEPTLARNFDQILQIALYNGSEVHFVTNSSLLNFKRIEQLTRFPVNICISIDGATKETFESIRTGAHFDLICDKLAMIKKLRDISLSQVSSAFSIAFVALKKNIHELPDVVKLAHCYGIMSVGVMDYAFGNRDFDEQSLRFDPIRANHFMEEAKEVAEKLGMRLDLPPFYAPTPPPSLKTPFLKRIKHHKRLYSLPDRFVQRCNSPWTEPYIHNDGTVSPCCTTGKSLGSIKKNSFEEVWNGWRYRLLRYRIHSPLPPTYCRDCNVCWGINGGNAGNAKAKEGLLVKIFYFFEYKFNGINQKCKNSFNKIVNLLKGKKSSPPNYFKGRPISFKNKCE